VEAQVVAQYQQVAQEVLAAVLVVMSQQVHILEAQRRQAHLKAMLADLAKATRHRHMVIMQAAVVVAQGRLDLMQPHQRQSAQMVVMV
jgi:uncharacterized protein (DUF2267 family)